MYARRVEEQTLTLAVSGMLWHGSLVMIDKQTRSLWSHLLGEAMRGPLQGKTLETIHSTMTDWKTWKSTHPETSCLVIPPTSGDYTRINWNSPMARTFLLIGIAENERARAWSLADLSKQSILNDSFSGKSIVVAYDETSGTAVIHGRSVDGKNLTFRLKEGKLFDVETGTEWDLMTGVALTPPLKGKSLRKVNGIISLEHAWHSFYPKSTYWQPEQK